MSQNKRSMAPSARTSFFNLLAGIIDATCNIVFLRIQLELRPASNQSWLHLVAIAGLVNRPKSIRIDLPVSHVCFYLLGFNSSGNFCDRGVTYSRELLIRIRTTSFGGCRDGNGSFATTEEVEEMSGNWRADRSVAVRAKPSIKGLVP